MDDNILKKPSVNKSYLKIIIFCSVIVVSLSPFLVISMIQEKNIKFENCYVENVKDNGKTTRIIIYSKKDISQLFKIGEKINVSRSGSKTNDTLFYGIVIKEDAVIQNNKSNENEKNGESFCLTIKLDNSENCTLITGEKVTISRAGIFNPLNNLF